MHIGLSTAIICRETGKKGFHRSLKLLDLKAVQNILQALCERVERG